MGPIHPQRTKPFTPPQKNPLGHTLCRSGRQPQACYYFSPWSWPLFLPPLFSFFSSFPFKSKPGKTSDVSTRLQAPRGCWGKAVEGISQTIKPGSHCEQGHRWLPVSFPLLGTGWEGWMGDCVQLRGFLFPSVQKV